MSLIGFAPPPEVRDLAHNGCAMSVDAFGKLLEVGYDFVIADIQLLENRG